MVQPLTHRGPMRSIRDAGPAWALNSDDVLVPSVGPTNVPTCFPGGILEQAAALGLSADQDDWNPGAALDPATPLATRIILATPSKANGEELVISGIVAPVFSGPCFPVIWLYNAVGNGAGAIVLTHLDTASAPGNRFDTGLASAGGGSVRVRDTGMGVMLVYIGVTWFVLRPWGNGPIAVSGLVSSAGAVEVYRASPLAFDAAMTMRFELTATRTDGGGSAFASFGRRGAFSRAASPAVTLQSGATETFYTEPGATTLVADFVVNGDNSVSATIEGVAAQTFRWHARVWAEVSP